MIDIVIIVKPYLILGTTTNKYSLSFYFFFFKKIKRYIEHFSYIFFFLAVFSLWFGSMPCLSQYCCVLRSCVCGVSESNLLFNITEAITTTVQFNILFWTSSYILCLGMVRFKCIVYDIVRVNVSVCVLWCDASEETVWPCWTFFSPSYCILSFNMIMMVKW